MRIPDGKTARTGIIARTCQEPTAEESAGCSCGRSEDGPNDEHEVPKEHGVATANAIRQVAGGERADEIADGVAADVPSVIAASASNSDF